MTNVQIIAKAQEAAGIAEPCHTYAHWKSLGFQVQKGSKALFKARIWKCINKHNEDTDEDDGKMFMKTASFFGMSQVEKVTA